MMTNSKLARGWELGTCLGQGHGPNSFVGAGEDF
jgi:hypothetical protein